VERQSGPGRTDVFLVDTTAGQFAHVAVPEIGVSVELSVVGPDGEVVVRAFNPNYEVGPEMASWIARASGVYQVRVSIPEGSRETGRYQIELTKLGAPSEEDGHRLEAESAFFGAGAAERAGGKEKQIEAIRGYERAAVLWRALQEDYEEALCFSRIGALNSALGEKQKALESYVQALPLRRAVGEQRGEAVTLNSIGNAYVRLGENRKALDYYGQSLPLRQAAGDRAGEAVTLNNIGDAYWELGEKPKALGSYEQALPLARAAGDRYGEAVTLRNLADTYADRGEKEKALEYYGQALPLARAVGDRASEALTLIFIGNLHSALGEKQKALDDYGQALALRRAAKDAAGEAVALNNIGNVYRNLGENQKALDYLAQALPLFRIVEDRSGEATALNTIGTIYSILGEKQKALEYLGQALPIQRALGDRSAEAKALNNIGLVYRNLGEAQKALDYLVQAVPLYRAAADRAGEGTTLNNIGLVYSDLGEKQKALEYYGQALPLYRAAGDRSGEATTVANIGSVYSTLGETPKALDYLGQALSLYRAVGDRFGEAAALSNVANVYSDFGENQKALGYYGQALLLRRAVGDRSGEANTLTNIASVYRLLGENQKALEYLAQALPIRRAVAERSGEAETLMSLGNVYSGLGQQQRALENYSQSLALYHAVGSPSGEATALTNIGNVYGGREEYRKALEYYEQALPLQRSVGDRRAEATTLSNIGAAHRELGEYQKALEYYAQALPLRRAVADPAGEGLTLSNMGLAYQEHGDYQKALECYAQALPLRRTVGDRSGEAVTLSNLASLFKDPSPDAAIWFGKQAVNVLQSIRHDNQALSDELKRSYEKSVEYSYRGLANLLVGRQRFGEAEEVLNLLKNKEASDFIRRDAVADQLRPAALLDSERKALERYEQIVGQVVTIGQQRSALLAAKRDKGQLDAAEVEQSARLDSDLAASNRVLLTFLQQQEKDFAPDSAVAKRAGDLREEAAGLQKALQKLGPDVVAIYTLVMPDKYIAMLVTGGARKAYTTAIKEADLNQKIFAFRQLLQNPASDPLPLARELYGIVFPEGLRQDLDAMQAQTIMWSIDSTLRYVPLAALHDGKAYLVTRFRNSLITPASLTRLTEASAAVWQGAGFGVSEARAKFTALPSVPAELHGIFRQNETEKGPIAGPVRLNGEFTRDSFENGLRARRNNVVHIATHFDSQPGVAANSHLLLGDGSEWSLAEIEDRQDLFDGVDLLTLSACSTAFTNKSEDGREVDSFGTIAQRLGAKGVIASLWSVSDEATARLMEAMYRNHQNRPESGKSEALRQAQEQMAGGVLKPEAGAAEDRGVRVAGGRGGAKSWTHPYYWAPFILIGNWK